MDVQFGDARIWRSHKVINENENYPNIQLRFGNFNKEERKKLAHFLHTKFNTFTIFY